MTKFNETQRQILQHAIASDGGAPEDIEPATAKTAIRALIKAGLLLCVPVDGGPSRLMITEAGRSAIGAHAPEAATVARPAKDTTAASGTATVDPKGKLGAVIALLRRPEGTTVEAMMAATGWQKHSVRGAMSGALKKKRGLTVTSEKTDTGRVYRITQETNA